MTTGSPVACRVAILDDDIDTAASIAAVLGRSGLQAAAFSTAASLLQACDEHAFDAFVLDWLLEQGTTLGVIRTLRAQGASARAPIFLLSGSLAQGDHPSDVALAQAIDSHDLRYRVKPYAPRRLAQEICAAVRSQA